MMVQFKHLCVIVAGLFLSVLSLSTSRQTVVVDSCTPIQPMLTTKTTRRGTCASIGYNEICCPYGRSGKCKAKDGDCYCHSDCYNDEECCEDVHCCSDAKTCAQANISSCCVPNEEGKGCMVYDYVNGNECSCDRSCQNTKNCCPDATCPNCTDASLTPGYCLWINNTSCVVQNSTSLKCYCDPFCRYSSLNDCCTDVPMSLSHSKLREYRRKMYDPQGNILRLATFETTFESDSKESQSAIDHKYYLRQLTAAKTARLQIARSELEMFKYNKHLQVTKKQNLYHDAFSSSRPLSHTYPYKSHQRTGLLPNSNNQHTSYSNKPSSLPNSNVVEANRFHQAYFDDTRPLPKAYSDQGYQRSYSELAHLFQQIYPEKTRPHSYYDEGSPHSYYDEAGRFQQGYSDKAHPRSYSDNGRPFPRAYP